MARWASLTCGNLPKPAEDLVLGGASELVDPQQPARIVAVLSQVVPQTGEGIDPLLAQTTARTLPQAVQSAPTATQGQEIQTFPGSVLPGLSGHSERFTTRSPATPQ